jgi:hypothetical protein
VAAAALRAAQAGKVGVLDHDLCPGRDGAVDAAVAGLTMWRIGPGRSRALWHPLRRRVREPIACPYFERTDDVAWKKGG